MLCALEIDRNSDRREIHSGIVWALLEDSRFDATKNINEIIKKAGDSREFWLVDKLKELKKKNTVEEFRNQGLSDQQIEAILKTMSGQ